MGTLHVIDETGDSKFMWDPENDDEVAAAEKQYKELKKKGYSAFGVKKNGEKGTAINEFDPDAGKIIMVPKMQAG